MTGEHLLSVRGLTVALPTASDRAAAIDNISFDLDRGETLCIVGESGSGKSVTAAAIMGLLGESGVSVTAGEIIFDGQDLLTLTEGEMRHIRGARIGMIFQEPTAALNPLMRVAAQIGEVMEAHGTRRRGRAARIVSLLHAVGLPDPHAIGRRYPSQLSGGQQQRVMIAMALALEPDILIADEPTTALDVTTQAQILALIRDLQRSMRMGVIFVTHDFGIVAEIADRIAVLRSGRLVELGRAADIFHRPQAEETKALLAAVPRFRLTRMDRAVAGDTLLRVDDVSKSYTTGGSWRRAATLVRALDRVSFEIRRGETVGLVGESGSGKSTLGRALLRLTDIDSGTILFDGEPVQHLRRRAMHRFRAKIQMIFQDPFGSLNPRHSVGRSVMAGPLALGVSRAEAEGRMTRLLGRVGLAGTEHRYPHEFSGGQRQRIGIARALAVGPQLLVADEAVSALDVSVQATILDLLREIRDEFGLAMLFITHDLRVASQLCDRLMIMHAGKIVEIGETMSILRNPADAYTRQLVASVPGRDAVRSESAACQPV